MFLVSLTALHSGDRLMDYWFRWFDVSFVARRRSEDWGENGG